MSRQRPNPDEFTREVADDLWLRNMLPNGALDAFGLIEDAIQIHRMQQRRFYPAERGYLQPPSVSTARHHRGEDADTFAAYDQGQHIRSDPAGSGNAPSHPWVDPPHQPRTEDLGARHAPQVKRHPPRHAHEDLSRKRRRGSSPPFPPLHSNKPNPRPSAPPPPQILQSNEYHADFTPRAFFSPGPPLTLRQFRRRKEKEAKSRKAADGGAHRRRNQQLDTISSSIPAQSPASPSNTQTPDNPQAAPPGAPKARTRYSENDPLTQQSLRQKAQQESHGNYLTCARCYADRFPCDHNYPCLKCESEGAPCQLVICKHETRDKCRTEHCFGLHPDQAESIKSQEGWKRGPLLHVDAVTGRTNVYPRKGSM
ncbi:hypothetical protein BDV97DRAFT_424438 [Delphinella strobiligena]|nr:hypothetical protein BDV97DRAFT_424438 [Delphinella strobiligena]